jgi:hypothetical protein
MIQPKTLEMYHGIASLDHAKIQHLLRSCRILAKNFDQELFLFDSLSVHITEIEISKHFDQLFDGKQILQFAPFDQCITLIREFKFLDHA